MSDFLTQFIALVKASSLLEWCAVLCSIAQVVLAAKNKTSNFIFGTIGVAIFVYIFIQSHLYADATLNVYYLVLSVYGLLHWRTQQHNIAPQHASTKEHFTAAGIALLSFGISYTVLTKFTNSTVPMADAALTAFAWAGTWLLARRKVESWLWLNASNAIAIPLYYHKQLALTVVLTIIQFIIAIFGYIQWRKRSLAS
ncbi:MAG: hypothetical protein RL660_1961 [Bacteroidota bacterium]|jgi:nicotinamide mononucleotide transporter